MTARTHADPARPAPAADAGSRRPRVLPVLVVGVLLAACVRALLVQSYVVASDALAPTVRAGDRVLLWTGVDRPGPGDLVVVDTSGTGPVDRATPENDGVVGRLLGSTADALGVRSAPTDALAVVTAVHGDRVILSAPWAGEVAAEDVVGVVGPRFWPVGRLGPVGGDA